MILKSFPCICFVKTPTGRVMPICKDVKFEDNKVSGSGIYVPYISQTLRKISSSSPSSFFSAYVSVQNLEVWIYVVCDSLNIFATSASWGSSGSGEHISAWRLNNVVLIVRAGDHWSLRISCNHYKLITPAEEDMANTSSSCMQNYYDDMYQTNGTSLRGNIRVPDLCNELHLERV